MESLGGRTVTDAEYRTLAQFRRALRTFLRFSEEAARAAGITPGQYQLMVMIRGAGPGAAPTVGDIADALKLRHHSAVELVDRAVVAGLVRRHPDPQDGRRQRLTLTDAGEKKLAALAAVHVEELRRLGEDGLASLGTLS
ncbi:MAG: MarR family winged helix-turn-helix transcriptional regulator [Actinomycetota bacterium]|nr:MarR family winged helix-turn-helix transcriptional regulator [Actinomycetota bacterium]